MGRRSGRPVYGATLQTVANTLGAGGSARNSVELVGLHGAVLVFHWVLVLSQVVSSGESGMVPMLSHFLGRVLEKMQASCRMASC